MASKPFCECEAQFCPHQAAGCPNAPVGKADVMTFHMNMCNDCFKHHSNYSPGDVSWLKLGIHASQKETGTCPSCGSADIRSSIKAGSLFCNSCETQFPANLAKKAMVTSDTQLETLTEMPVGESKDDLAVNSHPAEGAEGGAPVLDGELHHTERPNVSAMREAIETQDEMEVGKPIDVKQEEVQAESAEKEVTVEKGSGTQIIINIAGKKKTLAFSNVATAEAFIKGASAKYGDKFSVVASEKVVLEPGCQVRWHLHQLSMESREGTVIDVLPENPNGLQIFDATMDNGKKVWGYMGLVYEINGHKVKPVNPEKAEFEAVDNMAPEQDADNASPVTSGMSDIDGGAPTFKGAAADEWQDGYWKGETKDGYPPSFFDENDKLKYPWQDNPKREAVKDEGADTKYAIYTGPTIVKQVAKKFADAGWLVSNIGTERVYVITDKGVDAILAFLGPTWKNRDIQELPCREQDDETLRKTMKGAADGIAELSGGRYAQPREYVVSVGSHWLGKDLNGNYILTPSLKAALKYDSADDGREVKQVAAETKNGVANGEPVRIVPTASLPSLVASDKEGSMKQAGGMNFSPSNVPSQVVQEFYPELQHELISYPNATNAPMVNPEITGDAHELGTGQAEGIGEATLIMNNEDELLPGAIEDAFEGMNRIGYISTSPAGGAGIGRDGKPQVLEGLPLRKENDIRGPMFMEEFNAQYDSIPGGFLAVSASSVINKKVAAAEEKQQFSLFLKKVMGEVAASFLAAFKVTFQAPMNKIPGVGEIQLAQVEQPTNTSVFNLVNTGSRVKYLMEKLTDSEIQDCINDSYAQGAVWHEGKEGGFVYEVFVRAETIDTESMIMKYRFVCGTKE